MIVRKILLVSLIIVGLVSCKTQKEAISGSTTAETIEIDYKSEGYQKAYIRFFEENTDECTYLIQLESGSLLESLSLPEEFMNDRNLIWIKFVRQRRMSKCGEATPIEITDIKKRED